MTLGPFSRIRLMLTIRFHSYREIAINLERHTLGRDRTLIDLLRKREIWRIWWTSRTSL